MAEVHPAFGLGKKKCMNMNLTARKDFWIIFFFDFSFDFEEWNDDQEFLGHYT